MPRVVYLILGALLTLQAHAQMSDLSVSDHSTTYFGDSMRMAPLIEMVRKDYKGIIVARDNLCTEEVYEVGEVVADGEPYLFILEDAGIGNSCKGVRNLLVFKDGNLLGFYRTDIIYVYTFEGSVLLAQGENLNYPPEKADLSNGLPDKLPFWTGISFNKASKYERK